MRLSLYNPKDDEDGGDGPPPPPSAIEEGEREREMKMRVIPPSWAICLIFQDFIIHLLMRNGRSRMTASQVEYKIAGM